MTRVQWHQDAVRAHEFGLDRGVFYPIAAPGIPWSGLIAVDEGHVGGEVTPQYYNGRKYFDEVAARNFQATVKAYGAPREFEAVVGFKEVVPGFILTRQNGSKFGLSYRTQTESGYKIHLLYNATAVLKTSGFETMGSTVSPSVFEWTVSTVPELMPNARPSAHYVLDSRKIDPYVFADIEAFLYGNHNIEAGLPPQDHVVRVLSNLITEPLTEPV